MNVYKQKLNIKDQVKYLEDKGISFNLFSKSNAEDYLTNNNYYYKLTSFQNWGIYNRVVVNLEKMC